MFAFRTGTPQPYSPQSVGRSGTIHSRTGRATTPFYQRRLRQQLSHMEFNQTLNARTSNHSSPELKAGQEPPSPLPAEKTGPRENLIGIKDRRQTISSTRSTKSRVHGMSCRPNLPRVHGDSLEGAESKFPESKRDRRTFVILAKAVNARLPLPQRVE